MKYPGSEIIEKRSEQIYHGYSPDISGQAI
jgi:hypothetical protein